MNNLTDRKYSFLSTALPSETFTVVEFKGEEGLSMPYRFEILLASEDPEIDLGRMINSSARFIIHREEGDPVYFNGILSGFEQLHAMETYVFYRAVLAPKLWWLSLTHHNQIFLNQTVPEIIAAVLKDGGLTRLDFDLRLKGDYPKREYVCQYGETHLNFVSRWLEREGIYYYFEQSESSEKLIITDSAISHTENPRGGKLFYSPPSGLTDIYREEIIQAVVCRTGILPRKVLLKDYNYRKPSLEIMGTADVDPNGRGDVYLYGEHIGTPEEGNRLASIRAQELLCRKEEYLGDSVVSYIQPGYTFELVEHYRQSFNRKYLTIRMSHEGSQTGYLSAGIQKGFSDRESRVYYQNRFTAIPAGVQFRPQRTAEIPRISGIVSAKVDAAGSGKYAELDERGSYKVRLPFDLSGRKEGKASTWLRMAQPYAGSNHVMHFPLHKDTEVLITFTEGHPDRPLIAAAVPNPETPSPVTSKDATMAKITTAGGNEIHIGDQEGGRHILLHSPTANTKFIMGSGGSGTAGASEGGGDEGGGGESEGGGEDKWFDFDKGVQKGEGTKKSFEDGFMFQTDGSLNGIVNLNWDVQVGGIKNEVIVGGNNELVLGEDIGIVVGEKLDVAVALEQGVSLALKVDFDLKTVSISALSEVVLGATSTEIQEIKTEIHESKTGIREAKTELQTAKQEINDVHTALSATKSAMEGEVNKLRGAVTNMNGELTALRGSVTELEGDVNTMAGSVNEMAGDMNVMSGEIAELAGSRDTMAGDIADLAGAIEVLAGTDDIL